MTPILETCAELRMPVLAPTTPAECDYLMSYVPEATFIMAHAGGQPYAHGDWNRAVMVAQKHPNLYLDTACSTVDSSFVETCMREVGADRIILAPISLCLTPGRRWLRLPRRGLVRKIARC